MGSAMFEIGEVLGARGSTKAKQLRNGGTLFARVTSAPVESAGKLHLIMRGIGLKNVEGLFGKSDPFFEINHKAAAAGSVTWQPIYRSKHVNNDLNPKWEACTIDLDRIGGDLNQPLLIRIFDWEKSGKHQNLGTVETTVQGLIDAQNPRGAGDAKSADVSKAFSVMAKGKAAGKLVVTTAKLEGVSAAATTAATAEATGQPDAPTEAVAALSIDQSSVPPFSQSLDVPPPSFSATATALGAAASMSASAASTSSRVSAPAAPYVPTPLPPPMAPPVMAPKAPRPSFVDYISGGCELELATAIDFTGSNGDPRKPGTLHYIHRDGQLNDYEKAITAVGSVVARYDSDQKFPVYGFGAKYGGQIQHCFQVGSAPFLSGIQGILEGYRGVFRTGLTMSGPTVFSEVIDVVAAIARSRQEESQRIGKQSYVILLILTDGAVSDIEATKRSLTAASDAPLSIVIVGIGNADFSAMQFLDDFQDNGAGGGRDICQFVEFNKYRHDRAALTRETLDEIPDQLVDYFQSRGINPLPPISGSQISLAVSEPDEEDIDLNMDFSPEGEISLADYNGAVYDDTKYDTINAYTATPSVPAAAPYQSQAPAEPYQPQAPAAPYQPTYGAPPPAATPYRPQQQSAPYVPNQQQQAYTPHAPPPYQPHGGTPPAAYGAPPPQYGGAPPVAAVTAPSVFHVQVPPGVHPGQQLQVQNPVTGQQLRVVVPQGVGPGGKFAVQY